MTQFVSLQTVVEMTRSIPCAPSLLPKLLAMTRGVNSNAHDIEKLIQTDPGLATGVLRLANSAYFASSSKCDSLSEAILRLGSVALYRLAASTVAGRWLVQPVNGYGWQPGDLCRHSLCVAVAAEVFAQRTSLAEPETAYTAGLIHDVGKLALAYANKSAVEKIADLVPERHSSWRQAEIEVLGYDSCDVTKLLLKNWDFPSALISVGVFHQHPSDSPKEHRGLVTLIHAAKHVATQIGYGIGVDGFYIELDEPALLECGLTEELLDSEIPEILERVERFLEADGNIKGMT